MMHACLQMRNKFAADLALYKKYNSAIVDLSWAGLGDGDSVDSSGLIDWATGVINRGRTTKFEALIVLVVYKAQATKPIRALEKAEADFAVTKLLPSATIHPQLWAKVLELRSASSGSNA